MKPAAQFVFECLGFVLLLLGIKLAVPPAEGYGVLAQLGLLTITSLVGWALMKAMHHTFDLWKEGPHGQA